MRTLLITGASGYLGQRVLAAAAGAQADWPNIFAGIHTTPIKQDHIESIQLDLTNEQQLHHVFTTIQPDAVIHTAAVTPAMGPQMTERALWSVNVEATAKLAHLCREYETRLVYVSSDAIWGGRAEPYTEADVPAPINTYGASKAAAEAVLAAVYPQAIWVRTSLIYGHTPPDPNTLMAQELAAGLRPGVLFNDEYRCPIYVDDLAQALLELSKRSEHGPLNLAGPDVLSRYEFGKALLRWAGQPEAAIPVGSAQESGLRRPSRVIVSSDYANQLLTTCIRSIFEIQDQEVYGGDQPQSNR